MPREPKVTLTLSEADARWLMDLLDAWVRFNKVVRPPHNITAEIKHALAECECAKETR